MRDREKGVWVGLGGSCLLAALLTGWIIRGNAISSRSMPIAAPSSMGSDTPFAQALAQARALQLQAQVRVKDQLEALEEWDPDRITGSVPEQYRRLFLARTRELWLAREAAGRAVALAQTPDQKYRSCRLLARLECDAGRHGEELLLARRLVRIAPDRADARLYQQHAAACVGGHPVDLRPAMAVSPTQESATSTPN
jgi:hypothetical protein